MKQFSFELSDEGNQALAELQVATGGLSKSEVIRDALALFEVLIEKAKEGQKIFVGKDLATSIQLLMPSLDRVREKIRL